MWYSKVIYCKPNVGAYIQCVLLNMVAWNHLTWCKYFICVCIKCKSYFFWEREILIELHYDTPDTNVCCVHDASWTSGTRVQSRLKNITRAPPFAHTQYCGYCAKPFLKSHLWHRAKKCTSEELLLWVMQECTVYFILNKLHFLSYKHIYWLRLIITPIIVLLPTSVISLKILFTFQKWNTLVEICWSVICKVTRRWIILTCPHYTLILL